MLLFPTTVGIFIKNSNVQLLLLLNIAALSSEPDTGSNRKYALPLVASFPYGKLKYPPDLPPVLSATTPADGPDLLQLLSGFPSAFLNAP